MKKNNLYLLAFLLLAGTLFFSCKPKEERQLVNYWKLVEPKNSLRDSIRESFADNINLMMGSVNTIKEGQQRDEFVADINNKKAMLKSNDSLMNEQIATSFLEIKEGGLYSCNLLGQKEAGYWKYDDEHKEFITQPAGGAEGRLKIIKLGTDSLLLGEDERNSMLFIVRKEK